MRNHDRLLFAVNGLQPGRHAFKNIPVAFASRWRDQELVAVASVVGVAIPQRDLRCVEPFPCAEIDLLQRIARAHHASVDPQCGANLVATLLCTPQWTYPDRGRWRVKQMVPEQTPHCGSLQFPALCQGRVLLALKPAQPVPLGFAMAKNKQHEAVPQVCRNNERYRNPNVTCR